jgi:hypothetical protein
MRDSTILPFVGQFAHVAQQVEHFLGKEEVTDSSSVVGSIDVDTQTPVAQLVEQRIPNP